MKDDAIVIEYLPANFARWEDLLGLIKDAFAYMDGVVDPESSAKRLTAHSLARKAAYETCIVASQGGRLVGCLFVAERDDCLYVGKIAIDRDFRNQGIGRKLIAAAEDFARSRGRHTLELQTRVELSGNHAVFAHLGFQETGRSSHPGFDRPTTITMRKFL